MDLWPSPSHPWKCCSDSSKSVGNFWTISHIISRQMRVALRFRSNVIVIYCLNCWSEIVWACKRGGGGWISFHQRVKWICMRYPLASTNGWMLISIFLLFCVCNSCLHPSSLRRPKCFQKSDPDSPEKLNKKRKH